MRLILGILLGLCSLNLFAAETAVKRIGGDFKITSIERVAEGDFRIRFVSQGDPKKKDRLLLQSDHIHLSMQEGQVVRLSAEVLSQDVSGEFEVAQVLLFLSNKEYGTTPVWLLSSRHLTRDFRGSRWLDMHAPQADFQIF